MYLKIKFGLFHSCIILCEATFQNKNRKTFKEIIKHNTVSFIKSFNQNYKHKIMNHLILELHKQKNKKNSLRSAGGRMQSTCGLLLLICGDWQVASHNPFWAQSWSPPNEGVFQQLPAMTRHRLTCPSTFLLNWFVSILNKVGCLHVLIDRHVDGGWWRQLASAHVFLINILRLGFIWSDQVDISRY